MDFYLWYTSGRGCLVGSYVPINRGSVNKYIELVLSRNPNTVGRFVTLAYWVCDEHFDINNLNLDSNSDNGPRYCTSLDLQYSNGSNSIEYVGTDFGVQYADTNAIPNDKNAICRFNFTYDNADNNQNVKKLKLDNNGIQANKIFIALMSVHPSSTVYYDYNNSTLRVLSTPGTTYIKDNWDSNNIRVNNNAGLNIVGSLFEQPDGSSGDLEESTNTKPASIQCSDLRYRTWSDPDGDDFEITTSGYKNKYTVAFADGGNNHGDVTYSTLNYKYNKNTGKIKTYIDNRNNNFESDFNLPEGRLKDVVFANPQQGSYDSFSENSASEGRWVFKRSRIKFTIPPATKNGKVVNKGIVLRYKIVTSIYDKNVYTSGYKTKTFSVSEAKKDITLVICPRDEGVLDNMEFSIVLSRKYVGASDSNYSAESVYKFRTYQKPTVNIAYPKIIRNIKDDGFKYAKILTSNMYSNFNGENTIVNKYVCDALTVLLATPQNDASDIPMFVRFFLAEFKYGRDGRVNKDGSLDYNFDTVQALYKSNKSEKYTTKNEILTGTYATHKQTAFLTSIYANDGQPILLSGRFTKQTLADVGQTFKLWTYKDWDYVVENSNGKNNDELVGNPWPSTRPKKDNKGNYILDANGSVILETVTSPVIGDHAGPPARDNNGDPTSEQPVSKAILFRAGYIYLLRVRMFHGAAAGAIASKYNSFTSSQLKNKYAFLYGYENTGEYNYKNATYSSNSYYPTNDSSEHGKLQPYNGWIGPEDGTSGEPLYSNSKTYNDRLSQTYSGFSEVDYTLIEPVCPYTSKSNLITVHPTSPQIGVNQWITFNYRHLAKNIAGIDANATYYNTAINNYVNVGSCFGKRAGGIQNTLTRMCSMYTSAIESIIRAYANTINRSAENFNSSLFGNANTCTESNGGPILKSEKISIWINPIPEDIDSGYNQRRMTYIHDNTDYVGVDPQKYTSAYGKNQYTNTPLVYDYDITNKDVSNITVDIPYDSNSLCSKFSEYRKNLANTSNKNSYNYDLSSFNPVYGISAAPEYDIIYKKYDGTKGGTIKRYLGLDEPMGNSYRWQPVINAMTVSGSSVKEIQIENQNVSDAENYTVGANTLSWKNPLLNDRIPTQLIYTNKNSSDYDLQTQYFYTDNYTISPTNINMSNDSEKRFCIKEFGGNVTGSIHNPGFPVMYTSAAYPKNTLYNNNKSESIKYFCDSTNVEDYGHLYNRVSSLQDCECGIPTPDGLANVGNISSKGSETVNDNEHNVIPITRTTHYLYFKTWINTAFVVKVDVSLQVNHDCVTETITNEDGSTTTKHVSHTTETIDKTFWFDGKTLAIDESAIFNNDGSKLLSKYPSRIITLGNYTGLAEVYGEDNHGWGRCLSADDVSNRQIKFNGTINSLKTSSGGLEVPIMVRYTPLLQPRLLAKTCKNENTDDKNTDNETYLSLSSSNITLYKYRGQSRWKSGFVDSELSNNGDCIQIQTDEINLKIAYPYIKENNTYYTVSPNGGNTGGVYFNDYHIDVDTDASKSIDNITNTYESGNMDFLGGNGICTGYTVLLVPNNPKYNASSEYFSNTDGHWNFFKQKANYYSSGDIFSEVRSKSVKNCGPVLVAYNLQPSTFKNTCNYLSDENINIPSKFMDITHRKNNNFLGRNFQNIPLNFTNLRQGKVILYTLDNVVSQSTAKNTLGFKLDKANVLQVGVIYDLVIVPVYSNRTIINFNYGENPGEINGNKAGGGTNEKDKDVHLAGSNPLVLYNYFQIGSEIEISSGGGGGGGGSSGPEPNPNYINDSDSLIVFPNVDNKTYNVSNGQIKEPPGFWLNNSFKLILRMPAFRLKEEEYGNSDVFTIDNMSHGDLVTGENTSNDFEFSDIQIHIGKIDELKNYGYPNNQHLILDKITDSFELAKAHIISYSHFGSADKCVFSKKLSNYNSDTTLDDNDVRQKVTGGSLDPTDINYANRFIEINLSNCKIADDNGNLVPVYTKYPEGFYIQFRWKSKYAESQPEEHRWSDWYGGSCDGGLNWWGTNGLDYFVPVRNYSSIYTDFRNYIKESYPGAQSLPSNINELSDNTKKLIESITTGKGSILENGSVNENSLNNPKDAIAPAFYHIGVGNHSETLTVPSNEILGNLKTIKLTDDNLTIDLSKNNDSTYLSQYKCSHDINIPINGKQFSNNQYFWEMLYVDYIIRNLCKLYYKPYHNSRDTSKRLNKHLYYHSAVPCEFNDKIALSSIILNPLVCGWDNTEYRMFNDYELIRDYKGLSKEKEFTENKSKSDNKLFKENNDNSIRIHGPNNSETLHDKISVITRNQWDRNKYYRRVITRQDFDELNSHLCDLVKFIRHESFTGLTDSNKHILNDVLPVSENELMASFTRARAGFIGHDVSNVVGLRTDYANVNNINHTMADSNYIQNIWQNILSVCRPSIQTETRTVVEQLKNN